MLVPERGAPRMMTGSLITPGRLLDVAELLEGPEEGASAQIASHALVDDAEARIADRDDVRRLRDVGSAVGLLTAADLGEDPPPPGVAGTFEPVDDVVADGLVLPALQDAA